MKILVLGLSCSGKSTLAKYIGEYLSIDTYHLDEYYWKSPWIKNDDFDINLIINKNNWVIDGNYFQLELKKRLITSDVIIYLNCPLYTRIFRMLKRHIQYVSHPQNKNPISQKITLTFVLKTICDHMFFQSKIIKMLNKDYKEKVIYIYNSSKIDKGKDEFIVEHILKHFNSHT